MNTFQIPEKTDDSSDECTSSFESIGVNKDKKKRPLKKIESSKRKLTKKKLAKEPPASSETEVTEDEIPRKRLRPNNKANNKTSSADVLVLSRKFPESKNLSTAVRLHKDNVSAQVSILLKVYISSV